MSLRVAVVAWKLRNIRRDSQYFGHFHDLVSAAHDEGADVVVFPELHLMELLHLERKVKEPDVPRYLAQYAEGFEAWVKRIADSSGLILVSGSHFRSSSEGVKNVCAIGIPGQDLVFCEKNNLTAYEKTTWRLAHGRGLSMLANGLGVTVCYDSEFPEAARALSEKGMKLMAVPAWTETRRGFQRVRWACLSRAVENQNYVVHSSLVGSLGFEPAPETYGSSAIIAPSVEPFPTEAVLRETPLNEEGVVFADLDFDLLEQARADGEVANWEDRHVGDWSVEVSGTPPQTPPTPPGNVLGELN
jgi:predicted amidohydrolase